MKHLRPLTTILLKNDSLKSRVGDHLRIADSGVLKVGKCPTSHYHPIEVNKPAFYINCPDLPRCVFTMDYVCTTFP